MQTKPCQHCGKIISKKQSTSAKEWNEQTKFCSRQCYWRAKRRLPPNSELVALYDKGLSTLAIASQLKMNPSTIREYLLKAGVELRSPFDYDKPQCRKRSFGTCEVCGKTFDNAFKRGGTGKPRRFCSRSCKVVWYRAENVYNYLGEDAREFPHDLVFLTFWEKRAAQIRERDRVCQQCGKTATQNGRALDVHHVIPYRISKDNSPDNLVALCRSCHKRADHVARKGKRAS